MDITRREAIISIGYSLALMLSISGRSLAGIMVSDQPLPKLTDPDNPSYEVFYRLSQWITCKEDLDTALARKLYKIFQDEPWGKQHISRSYIALKDSLTPSDGGEALPDLLKDNSLGEAETWFISHLLTTWYLGVYYHSDSDPVRVTNEGALVWDVVGHITGIPGITPNITSYDKKPELE